MTQLLATLKQVLLGTCGVFTHIGERKLPKEIQEMRNEVYALEIESMSSDKENMGRDLHNFKQDFKKAVRQYQEEMVNG